MRVIGNLKLDSGQLETTLHDNGNSGAGKTIDWNKSNVHKITLDDTASITFSNPTPGGRYTLLIKQDGFGGRSVNWPGGIKWTAGAPPSITGTADKIDMIHFVYDGDDYLGYYRLNF